MKRLFVVLSALYLGACSTDFFSHDGPTAQEMVRPISGVDWVVLDAQRAKALLAQERSPELDVFLSFEQKPWSDQLAVGQKVEVTLFESAPSLLLSGGSDGGSAGARSLVVPAQPVSPTGYLSIPFVGQVYVIGKTPQEVQEDIVRTLKGKANAPQAVVRVVSEVQEVTVIGEVRQARRVPLSAQRERLLDVIAQAGGASSAVEKTLVQVSREGRTIELPLEIIIRTPQYNFPMSPGDVVTLYHQSRSFVALGAVNKPGEIPFEATGIRLSQAIARAGGLNDARAKASSVFLARIEQGKPTIYQIDLSQPESILVMRDVPMKDGDLLYVVSSSSSDVQKFLQLVNQTLFPISVIQQY